METVVLDSHYQERIACVILELVDMQKASVVFQMLKPDISVITDKDDEKDESTTYYECAYGELKGIGNTISQCVTDFYHVYESEQHFFILINEENLIPKYITPGKFSNAELVKFIKSMNCELPVINVLQCRQLIKEFIKIKENSKKK